MGIKNFVDFTRIDIIAAAQGHILFVVANIQISGFVEFTDISREQPALPQGGGRFLGPVALPRHDLRPPQTDFALFARSQNFVTGCHVNDFDLGQG